MSAEVDQAHADLDTYREERGLPPTMRRQAELLEQAATVSADLIRRNSEELVRRARVIEKLETDLARSRAFGRRYVALLEQAAEKLRLAQAEIKRLRGEGTTP